jgi:hypothetical protein
MAVPYTFGSATTSIPLSQLDSNFATTITLGNTAIQLGNTVTTLNNMTLANATVSSGNITVLNATVTNDASIHGLTVGQGAVASNANVAFGNSVLGAVTSGTYNTGVGYGSLQSLTSGNNNTAIGFNSLNLNTSGGANTALGQQALNSNTTGSNNVAIGYQANYSNNTDNNTIIGAGAGYSTTGRANTFIGRNDNGFGAGNQITTGYKNTIIGGFAGNQGGLDIRTANNYIVLADGDGNPRQYINGSGQASWGSPMIDGFLNLKWAGQSYIGMVYNNTDAFGSSANIRFKNNGTTVGDITSTTSATAYNTSSDYRLKHDVQPMVGALAKISQLKPVTYKWNIDDSDGQGFIAHELQEVFPDAVHGEKDAVEEDGSIKPQGIDTSFLVATLAASIQELKTIVDAQAATIAALQAKVGA